jgi:multicomponent K+:H+ antiporter subunit F
VILQWAVLAGFAMMSVAALLNLWRLWRGPDVPDRVVALDTLYINTIALLVLAGIHFDSNVYFESALVLAVVGFVTTVSLCKYLLRGDIIE